MKNKRLLALFIVLIIIVVLVILGSTVFTIKEITVVLHEEKEGAQLYNGKEDEIAQSLKGELMGKSVFLLTDSAVEDMITDPYLELVRSVVAFPNKITIHVAERKEMFAVKYEEKYYMLDRHGVVLAERNSNSGNLIDQKIYSGEAYADGKNIEVTNLEIYSHPILGKVINADVDKLSAMRGVITSFYEDAKDPTVDITWRVRAEYISTFKFTADTLEIKTKKNHADQYAHTIILHNYNTDANGKMSAAWIVHSQNDNLSRDMTFDVYDKDINGKYTVVPTEASD